MDYKDIEAGATEDFFWFKAKLELIDILLDSVKSRNRIKILSIGCGVGRELEVIKKYGDIYVIDIDSRVIELIPAELYTEKKVCDICNAIPYPDKFFDLVAAFDVLEHLRDDYKAVGEIHRVLKPDGLFIFTVPAFPFLFSSHDMALQHYRRYNKAILKNLLHQFNRITTGFWIFSLFLPVAIERLLKYREITPAVHYRKLPVFVNNMFYRLLKIENWLIKHGIPLPIGTTIYGTYRLKQGQQNSTA